MALVGGGSRAWPQPASRSLGLRCHLLRRAPGEPRPAGPRAIGVLSPVVGDNIGYRIGRRYGGAVIAMKRFKSLQDRILVRRLEKKEVTKGGIIISDAA